MTILGAAARTVTGDAYCVRIGPGNKIHGLRQGDCVEHVDPIQLYGAPQVVVSGSYFHDNGDGTGMESFDGDDCGTVTNNVFVCTCIYPYSVTRASPARATSPGEQSGRAIFVSGAKRNTYARYRLAAGSPGKRVASDGTDMGIRVGC